MKRVLIVGLAATASLGFMGSTAGAATKSHHKVKHAKAKVVKAQPWIGSTLTVENESKQYENIQLQAVTDPAQGGDQFTTPDAGKRFVGVTLAIHLKSKGTDTGDANNNTTVIGSNKQVYTADFDTLSGCTDFADGEYTLANGATEVGCVAFQIPTGVTVAKVQYNPNSGFSTNVATWTAPK